MILLSSSEPQSMSFIETANLDGETNLKIRQAVPATARLLETRELVNFNGTLECEPPNRHLYEFNGVLKERGQLLVPKIKKKNRKVYIHIHIMNKMTFKK